MKIFLVLLVTLCASAENYVCASIVPNCIVDELTGEISVDPQYREGVCGQLYLKQCIIRYERNECTGKVGGLLTKVTGLKTDKKELLARIRVLEQRIKRLNRKRR